MIEGASADAVDDETSEEVVEPCGTYSGYDRTSL